MVKEALLSHRPRLVFLLFVVFQFGSPTKFKSNCKMKFFCPSAFVVVALLLLTCLSAAEDLDDTTCDDPIPWSSSCSVTSLCDDGNDAVSGSLCYRVRSCFLGYCSTSDLQEGASSVDDVCESMTDWIDGDEEGTFCMDDWDSSWWMTDYVQAVDCEDVDTVYLDCSDSIGDVSSSTTASLGFSMVGFGVAIAALMVRRRQKRRRGVLVLEDDEQAASTEMPDVTSTSFSRMA